MTVVDRLPTVARAIIGLIAVVQVILGLIFILSPRTFPELLGLPAAPGWTDWIFAQFGARALGFAYGMWLVLCQPRAHSGWIKAMIGVQVLDWLGTVLALTAGKVTMAQVATAPILPILFVAVLALELRRQALTSQTASRSEA